MTNGLHFHHQRN